MIPEFSHAKDNVVKLGLFKSGNSWKENYLDSVKRTPSEAYFVLKQTHISESLRLPLQLEFFRINTKGCMDHREQCQELHSTEYLPKINSIGLLILY